MRARRGSDVDPPRTTAYRDLSSTCSRWHLGTAAAAAAAADDAAIMAAPVGARCTDELSSFRGADVRTCGRGYLSVLSIAVWIESGDVAGEPGFWGFASIFYEIPMPGWKGTEAGICRAKEEETVKLQGPYCLLL